MAYFLNLFSPETYQAYKRSSREVSGFRASHRVALSGKIQPGDKLVCYMTKLSRWFGVLQVLEGPYTDQTPIFYTENDPLIVRFRVKPLVFLEVNQSIPIHEDEIWHTLSFTKGLSKSSTAWTGIVRSSLGLLKEVDGQFLEKVLSGQARSSRVFPIDEKNYKKLVGSP